MSAIASAMQNENGQELSESANAPIVSASAITPK